MAGCSPSDSDKAHGIPARTPASTALWAHLLRKDTLGPPPNSGIIIPPITPLDKNGTSMRILLHDTQANFEKFSVRVDKLCSGVDEAKREIAMANTMFQRQNDSLTEEVADLVNRTQTEIQKALGIPSQAGCVERLFKDMDRRLDTLAKRTDAIQLFHQTHSQTLQLQSQALQSLQNQHGTIVAALLPLLPLLQAIPLHIETAKSNIVDNFKESLRSHTAPFSLPDRQINRRGHKRTSSVLGSDQESPSPLSNKRSRVNAQAKGLVLSLGTGDNVCESDAHRVEKRRATRRSPGTSSSHTAIAMPTATEDSAQNRNSSNHNIPNIDLNSKHTGIGLGDTSTAVKSQPHTRTRPSTPAMTERASGPLQPVDLFLPPLSGITLSAKRPPRLLRLHSTASQAATHTATIISSEAAASATLKQGLHSRSSQLTPLPPSSRISEAVTPGLSKRTPIPIGPLNATLTLQQEISQLSLRVVESTPSIDFPQQHNVAPSFNDSESRPRRNAFRSTRHLSHTPATDPANSISRSSGKVPLTPIVLPEFNVTPFPVLLTQPQQLRSGRSTIHPPPTPRQGLTVVQNNAPAAQVRERRSPFREGRRFIPLGDSDDEDEV